MGLQRFYDLRGTQNLIPVSPQAFRERDYSWLEELARAAERSAIASVHLRLAVQGLSCIGCVWLMERIFRAIPGALRLDVNTTRGELNLEYEPHKFDAVDFARELQHLGYLVGKADVGPDHAGLSGFNRRLGLCGAFAMNAMAFCLPSYVGMSPDFMFASWFDLVAACSATLSLLVGGSYFVERSVRALRHGVLHIDTPIALGIMAAWSGSMLGWIGHVPSLKYFDFVSVFIFLMLAGRWLQQTAVERNRRRLLRISNVPEDTIELNDSGPPRRISLSAIKVGTFLSIKPGEVCPIDSILRSTTAALSLEWINGESQAASRLQGQTVPSGAVNISARPMEVEAREKWADALLCRLAQSREAGQGTVPSFSMLLRIYLGLVVLVAVAGAAVWWSEGQGAPKALQVMISVLVVSCPCALGVAAPFADDLAASWMERLGVYVRTHGLWQKLARVRKVVFDKTGTLTLQNPMLRNPDVLQSLSEAEKSNLRHLAGSNLHPVSRSLFDAIGPACSKSMRLHSMVNETVGQGLSFVDAEGRTWSLGRPGWRGGFSKGPIAAEGDTEFCRDGKVLAAFCFDDALRPETQASFARLRSQNLALTLLSGDRLSKVEHVATMLSLKKGEWLAEMTPDDKARWVRGLNQNDTLFIGDGANDSLALEAALCGGSPVTGRSFLEHKADFYFLGNSLRFVPTLLEVARLRQRAVRRVFTFALAYNFGAVAVSLSGWMSPLLAAVLMPLSSLATLMLARVTFGSHFRTLTLTSGGSQEPAALPQRMQGQTTAVPV